MTDSRLAETIETLCKEEEFQLLGAGSIVVNSVVNCRKLKKRKYEEITGKNTLTEYQDNEIRSIKKYVFDTQEFINYIKNDKKNKKNVNQIQIYMNKIINEAHQSLEYLANRPVIKRQDVLIDVIARLSKDINSTKVLQNVELSLTDFYLKGEKEQKMDDLKVYKSILNYLQDISSEILGTHWTKF